MMTKSLLIPRLSVRLALPALLLAASSTAYAQAPPDFTPPTPLFRHAAANDTAQTLKLLESGANPNEERLLGMPAIFFAAINQNLPMLRAMVAKGADVKALDGAGSTVLMWAAANEEGRADLVKELLKAGADPSVKNLMGETALDWAMRRGSTPAVAALLAVGASTEAANKRAVESAMALLQKSGPQFVRVSGCTSCHHQSLPQMAGALAKQRGYAVDEKLTQESLTQVVAAFRPARELMLKGTDALPDPPIVLGYSLLGLHAGGYKPDDLTAAMAHLITTKQAADGRFPAFAGRPPMESSDITATALGARAVQLYGTNVETVVSKAGQWLRSAQPKTGEEYSMRLLGLAWTQAPIAVRQDAARALLALQRPDGGWGQLSTIESDAYATGQALVALHEAGIITTADEAYRRGAAFLLRTQLKDGSWLVRSRAFPFQPYKESGFPHGRDQWISASGTAWAAMALSLPPAEAKPQLNSGAQ
ncbi:MAG: ankyrin repeat domain-containing protein [Acidobacteria bacterium]|nr:ankyrin repeat domain-containing protein [Acidobacteriota bacterium]